MGAFRRQRTLLILGVILSAGIALGGAWLGSTQVWEASGSIRLNPTVLVGTGRNVPVLPEPGVLAQEMLSAATLEEVRRTVREAPPVAEMAKMFTVSVPLGGPDILIQARAPRPSVAKALVDAMIETQRKRFTVPRNGAVQTRVSGLTDYLQDLNILHEEAINSLNRLRSDQQVEIDGVETELERFSKSVSDLEARIANHRQEQAKQRADLRSAEEALAAWRARAAKPGATALDRLQRDRWVDYSRTAQARIEELAREIAGDQLEHETQVTKRSSLQAILERRAALEREVAAIEASTRTASQQLNSMRTLAEKVPEELLVDRPPQVGEEPRSSNHLLVFVCTLFGALSLCGVLTVVADARARSYRSRLASVVKTTPSRSAGAEGQADDEDSRLGTGIMKLTVRDGQVLFLATNLRHLEPRRGATVLLSRLDTSHGMANLILSLARFYSRRGERVLVMDIAGDPIDQATLHLHLSRHTEPTVVSMPKMMGRGFAVDYKQDKIEAPLDVPAYLGEGLTNYLTDPNCTLEALIRTTSISSGVELLLVGNGPPSAELLVGPRLPQALETARQKYGIVLILGPSARHRFELESLAGLCDGVLWFVSESTKPIPDSPTLTSTRGGVSILGQVIYREK